MIPRTHGAVLSPRAGLVAAFAVIVAALAVVAVLVWVELEPQLQSLRDIANDHARAVQVTTGIRARISAARRDVLALASGDGGEDPGHTFARLVRDAEALRGVAETRAKSADLDSLQEALSRCRDESLRIAALIRDGYVVEARARLEGFVELTRLANEAADQIVSFNATEVEQLSRRIRLELRWTLLATTALSFLGTAAAGVLLRRALRGLAMEESLSRVRSAEVEGFAARAAHELRTPLQTLALALGALERGGGAAIVAKARRSAERLRETVDGLLEFARAGASAPAQESADPAQVIAAVEEDLAAQLASAGAALQVEVVPGSAVAISATHLGTVLRNLVGNAVKYAAPAPGARVAIRVAPANGRVRLEVADDGPGIPPEALPRVFDPFFRATSKRSGHGLGLATVRRLVEAHGGVVRIDSAPGSGTTVTFELPRAAAEPRSPA